MLYDASPSQSLSCVVRLKPVLVLMAMMCPASYGLEVAALAGVPRSVTRRAHSAGTILERKLQRAFGTAPSETLSTDDLRLLRRLRTALACGGSECDTQPGVLTVLWHDCHTAIVL